MMKPKVDNDNKMLKSLREVVASGGNRQCFDCGQKGVTYVNMTTGTFVCTTCSGILRGLTPPHRVKSISMAKFTDDELEFLRTHGNDECAKTWLGLWDSKRTLKQDHREFMIDKYERKRYYLEPASPLKSINTTAQPQQQQQPPLTNGVSKTSQQQVDNSLAVLKSIQLTPPAANNRHHHRQNHANQNGFSSSSDFQNNNFFHQNGAATTNGSIKSESSNDFIADFSKASIHNSNNSLNSTESGGHVNGKMFNGNTTNGDVNDNFADFENNKIYNAAEEFPKNNNSNNNSLTNNNIQWNVWQQFQWPNQPEQNRWSLPMTKGSLSNSLNSSGGTFNSNSSISSTPSADRYAALKDLDEQLRESKNPNGDVVVPSEPAAVPVNPFKNPFQPQQQQQQQQQSYQNWTIPESQPFNGFGSPLNNNGFSNGFYYNHNMTNGIISQPSAFGKGGFGNPFVASGSASANNPFL